MKELVLMFSSRSNQTTTCGPIYFNCTYPNALERQRRCHNKAKHCICRRRFTPTAGEGNQMPLRVLFGCLREKAEEAKRKCFWLAKQWVLWGTWIAARCAPIDSTYFQVRKALEVYEQLDVVLCTRMHAQFYFAISLIECTGSGGGRAPLVN